MAHQGRAGLGPPVLDAFAVAGQPDLLPPTILDLAPLR
jgi:hypothetical protein